MKTHSTDRRRFLKAAGAATLAAAGATHFGKAHAAKEEVPYSSGTDAPKLEVPRNACDCHMHIYDSRFPFVANAVLKPPDARVEDYERLQKRLGTKRCVVVQPSSYGTDNRCTLDAVKQLGDVARAVAVVDTSVSDSELQRLNSLGVRGIRFNLVQKGATSVEMIEPLSKRVEPLGWHLQFHLLADQIDVMKELFDRVPTQIVFDHFGRIPVDRGTSHPAYTVISRLIDKGRAWVKLSSLYQDSKEGPPMYADLTPLARAYLKQAPERMLWATDWPHPTHQTKKPDDAQMFDVFGAWVPDKVTRQRILVENPEKVYGFPKGSDE
jgi:D-galactarolactone isomerase